MKGRRGFEDVFRRAEGLPRAEGRGLDPSWLTSSERRANAEGAIGEPLLSFEDDGEECAFS